MLANRFSRNRDISDSIASVDSAGERIRRSRRLEVQVHFVALCKRYLRQKQEGECHRMERSVLNPAELSGSDIWAREWRRRLSAAGLPMIVYDRDRARADALGAAGVE